MSDTTVIQGQDLPLATMSELELLEYVRCFGSAAENRTDIAHDHRRFLGRQELERLARLVWLRGRHAPS